MYNKENYIKTRENFRIPTRPIVEALQETILKPNSI
jgi:hypothetical protein